MIVVHYGEIGLKGKNRKFFEERLIKNIKEALFTGSFRQVKRISGRLLISLAAGANRGKVKQALLAVFGVTHFAFAQQCQANIKEIKQAITAELAGKKFSTFKVLAKRSDKKFPLTSQQINEIIGEYILASNPAPRKVNLDNPDMTVYIEIVDDVAFVFTEKIKGLAGLPVGVSGRAISLISGGIDSPVASFLAMKRGLEVIFLHFHALPFVDTASLEKVKELTRILSKHQNQTMVYLIPFADIQKEILLKTKESLRVVLYRRMMFKIAQEIASKERAQAIITGENLGQVASQTIENIAVIENGIALPILRPLITYDKQEIIEKAKDIGTFNLSIQEHQDCCSRFLPKSPETRANLPNVLREEKKIRIKKLIKIAIQKIEVITYK